VCIIVELAQQSTALLKSWIFEKKMAEKKTLRTGIVSDSRLLFLRIFWFYITVLFLRTDTLIAAEVAA